ncbi:hypothetical protein M434DRAFT_395086 [Hypoxylon sp. CO27-5]|nr:hypothetical protein M434DRAFT_395086 [Hypoxylon sp. CO27-5]
MIFHLGPRPLSDPLGPPESAPPRLLVATLVLVFPHPFLLSVNIGPCYPPPLA